MTYRILINFSMQNLTGAAQKSSAAGASPRTPLGELTTLPQTPKSEGSGRYAPHAGLGRYAPSTVPECPTPELASLYEHHK